LVRGTNCRACQYITISSLLLLPLPCRFISFLALYFRTFSICIFLLCILMFRV
jgi:hypothetical protein